MNISGQGHSLILVQGHLDSTCSTFFSLETAKPTEAKFHVDPPWDGDTKVCSNGLGHLSKMAGMPIYGKSIIQNLLGNQKADDLESWYAASVLKYYQVRLYYDPGLTFTYFTARSNYVPYAFVWDEGKTMAFSETIVVYDIKVGRCSQLNE